jgi:hypothetical protein
MSSSSTGSWFDAEKQSLAEIIEEFGEPFTLTPYRTAQVNFPTSPDPARTAFDFSAVFERDAKNVSLGMEEVSISTRHLCLTALVCDVPYVKQGDRILHKLTGEVFEVTDPRPDGISGIEMRMVQLGRQKQ